METMTLPKGKNKHLKLDEFIKQVKEIQTLVVKPMSARGWGYFLEGENVITKAEIDLVEGLINHCRKNGLLPIDFTAEEEGRQFSGIEVPTTSTPIEYMRQYLEAVLGCEEWYTPDWWDGEKYYIQMIVEKIDLKYLFEDVCKEYHIPIATAKGWSSIRQRAEYADRFKDAEEDRGLKCVLLYCGDHDPDGLRISQFLRSNLDELKNVVWSSGKRGYDPKNLIIDRFGLNYEYIIANNLVWVENLITGSKKNLADPNHKNYNMEYLQTYLSRYGARKVEANAILKNRDAGIELCRGTIEKYLGSDALNRFEGKRNEIREEMQEVRKKTNLKQSVEMAIHIIDEAVGA